MAKKVLIIATSPRVHGNSSRLAQEFAEGAKKAGHETDIVYLAGKKLSFCRGCLRCQETRRCVIDDDAVAITEKIRTSDVIVWATPVYYYAMSGQMKTMIDRSNPLYGADNRFKDVYLLASAAEEADSTMDGTINGLEGWIACHPGVTLKGVVRALGVGIVGSIDGNPALKQAYDMGASV